MLSMASALEITKKTRCRVFVEVVTTSTVHYHLMKRKKLFGRPNT